MLPAALLCAARGRVPVLPVCRQMLLQVISSAMVLLLRRRCGAVAIHVMLLCRQRYGADAIAMAGGRLLWEGAFWPWDESGRGCCSASSLSQSSCSWRSASAR